MNKYDIRMSHSYDYAWYLKFLNDPFVQKAMGVDMPWDGRGDKVQADFLRKFGSLGARCKLSTSDSCDTSAAYLYPIAIADRFRFTT